MNWVSTYSKILYILRHKNACELTCCIYLCFWGQYFIYLLLPEDHHNHGGGIDKLFEI